MGTVRQAQGVALGHRVAGAGAAPPPGVAHGDVGLPPAVVPLERLLGGEWTRPDQVAVRGGKRGEVRPGDTATEDGRSANKRHLIATLLHSAYTAENGSSLSQREDGPSAAHCHQRVGAVM